VLLRLLGGARQDARRVDGDDLRQPRLGPLSSTCVTAEASYMSIPPGAMAAHPNSLSQEWARTSKTYGGEDDHAQYLYTSHLNRNSREPKLVFFPRHFRTRTHTLIQHACLP